MHETVYRPEDGVVTAPDEPGLGMELDEGRIESKRAVSAEIG